MILENLEAKNYFEIFSLPLSHEIDLERLREIYLRLQAQYHPDKFLLASRSEQEQASKNSKIINKGYFVLSNPIELLDYMLALQGFNLSERFAIDLDNDFLEQVFVWQGEMLDSSRAQEIRDKISMLRNELLKSAFFQIKQGEFVQAFESFKRLKFLERLLV